MKIISLTQNKFAIVSDIDFPWLNQNKWCVRKSKNRFYAVRRGPKHGTIWMHKEILGVTAGLEGDHISGDSLDNRRGNLRKATHQQNCCNIRHRRYSKSGYRGVYEVPGSKWRAEIRVFGKLIYLGRFDNPLEAANSYNKAADRYFGQFAVLNNATPIHVVETEVASS